MPITSFTIAGDEVNPLFETMDIRKSAGSVGTLSCDVTSVGSPVQRFNVFDPVVIVEDGVTIFSGRVTQTREQGFGGPNIYDEDGAPQIVTTVTAEDQFRLAERVGSCVIEVAEGTSLLSVLGYLVTVHLSAVGVTLHPDQVLGPSLPQMSFDMVTGATVLNALTEATGYLHDIDYNKRLRMWEPGELAAPFDIDEYDDPAKWTGDVTVETIIGDNYANRVIVRGAKLNEERHEFRFQGDGSTDTYTLDWDFIQSYGIIHIYELDGVTPAGGETFGIPPDAPLQWEYNGDGTITRTIGPTDATKIYALTFHGTFEAEAMAEDAAAIADPDIGLYEIVIVKDEIETTEAAQEIADAVLAERLDASDQVIAFATREVAPTLYVGQLMAVSAADSRNVDGDFIIRDLRIRAETPATEEYADAGLGLIRELTAKKHEVMVGKWQHTYRDWLRFGQGGGTTSTGAGGGGDAGPDPPDESVQTNQGGLFDGDEYFLFNKATATVMIGSGHTPGGLINLLNGENHTVE